MKIFVGNLTRNLTQEELREAFAPFGQVDSATIITDKFSGESRGFGFIEMGNATEAQAAIQALNGKDLKGRAATVNEARPPSNDRRGGGGGGGGGYRRGGGGGGGYRGGRDRDRF